MDKYIVLFKHGNKVIFKHECKAPSAASAIAKTKILFMLSNNFGKKYKVEVAVCQ